MRKQDERAAAPTIAWNDEARALEAAARVLSESGALARVLRAQLGIVHELTRSRSSFVSLLDPARGILPVLCSRGRADPRIRAARPGEGVVGQAFERREIIQSERPAPMLAIGLAQGEQALGALCLIRPQRRPHPEALRALAAQLAAAVDAARLRDEAARRTRDLEDAVARMKTLERQREEFLKGVSHELKTPLTTIKTYLSMLLRQRMGAVGADQERALAICDRNSDRLLRLIDDLLLVSRLSAGEMNLRDKPFGLKALLEECAARHSAQAERARVALLPATGGELYVRGDREHLLEAFSSLIDNAIRYNAPGGKVWTRLSSRGAVAHLEVGDSGQGIGQAKLASLFDPFAHAPGLSRRGNGSSQGLARVNQVVQLHGGSVSAQSVVGKGSAFSVTLPLFAGMVGQAEASRAVARARSGGILLVEDDDDCRDGVRDLLESEGLQVSAVASVDAAIAALNRSRPALVLLDLRLKDGDGKAVVSHVRATPGLSDLPVFVMSGAVGSAAGLSGEGPERIDGFFEKPLNLPRLLTRVRAVVQPPRAHGGG